jgi:hypothetical protein
MKTLTSNYVIIDYPIYVIYGYRVQLFGQYEGLVGFEMCTIFIEERVTSLLLASALVPPSLLRAMELFVTPWFVPVEVGFSPNL